jgi:hypothetical protein
MRELHESQLKAYEEAARAALTELAQSVTLPTIEDDMDEEVYVQKVLGDYDKPDWKVDEVVWEEAWATPLRERARAAFESEEDEADDLEDTDEEEGEEKAPTTVKKMTVNKRTVATKAGKGLLKKKALSAAKPGAAGGQRGTRGRRARRGGRGGAGAAK